jgi:dsRNA-specific ribonuclease
LVDERITGNTRRFTVAAYVNNEELGRGEGPNKKEAEKQASKAICETLSIAKQMGIIADDD